MALDVDPSYTEPRADDPDQDKTNEDQIDGVREKVPGKRFEGPGPLPKKTKAALDDKADTTSPKPYALKP